MLDNQVIDMGYWKFKELYQERNYPMCYSENSKAYTLMMYERHRGYRCKVIKSGYEDSYITDLTSQQVTDVETDFNATGSIKENAKLVEDITNEAALGINVSSFKYNASFKENHRIIDLVQDDIPFEGKCKSIWVKSDKDLNFQINNGDVIYVHHGVEYQVEFDYKLVNPVFNFTSQNGDGWLNYYIDGEVL
jgi:hypothetical protein